MRWSIVVCPGLLLSMESLHFILIGYRATSRLTSGATCDRIHQNVQASILPRSGSFLMRLVIVFFVAFATLIAAVLVPNDALSEEPALITITGKIISPNRGALDPERDKLFAFHDVQFDEAAAFGRTTLSALPQTTITTDFPAGGAHRDFAGPLLVDVLNAAGAEGDTVQLMALDGYVIEAPLDELQDKGAVLALSRDGTPLAIGGLGPAQLVFPRVEREDLKDMSDDLWIWQIFHISVK